MLAVIKESKDLLAQNLGENLQNVILFGSQAQGNAKPDSDYDLLVVLKNVCSYSLKRKILDICCELCVKYEVLLDVKIISQYELDNTLKGKQPLYTQAILNGIYL